VQASGAQRDARRTAKERRVFTRPPKQNGGG
jgi:hypothetical protein